MHKASEDYLEAIYVLEQRNGSVHSVEVAAHLGVSKPSVSRAVNALREAGYLSFGRSSALTLTPKGRESAKEVYSRHTAIARFLMMTLGVTRETAEHDACLFEHDISPETLRRMLIYIHNVK